MLAGGSPTHILRILSYGLANLKKEDQRLLFIHKKGRWTRDQRGFVLGR